MGPCRVELGLAREAFLRFMAQFPLVNPGLKTSNFQPLPIEPVMTSGASQVVLLVLSSVAYRAAPPYLCPGDVHEYCGGHELPSGRWKVKRREG